MAHGASHKALIWKVFIILSVITIVEVVLGIIKPDSLYLGNALGIGTSWLNIIFLLLTIVKAYYIAWFFMHLADEKKGLQYAIALPLVFLITYLAAILLNEGAYVYDTLYQLVNWNY